MQSLFWKIFGWFLGAIILIALALYGLVLTTRPEPLPQPWRETASAALHAYASSATQTFQTKGRAALSEYLNSIGNRSHALFWLYDQNGREVSGHPMPPPRPDPSLLPNPKAPASSQANANYQMLETPERMKKLWHAAMENKGAIFEKRGPRVLAAQAIQSARGETWVLAASLPEPRFPRRVADARQHILGALLLLALSILVCYGLVRYLTSPLISLREATRRFAEGDLSSRTGAAQNKRRDEVADLGRDFDAMASRIEFLMTSQRRLLGDVSHELRSPLTRLSMALALARRHAASTPNPELEDAFGRIGREKERLNELIGQLLELARLESGEATSARETIQLHELLQDVVADADFEAEAQNKRVLITRAAACELRGTRELLRRALENIVRNALHYAPENSNIEVSLDVDGVCSVVHVRDYGAGVPEESLSKIFEPFYRVETARDRNSGGVGLGLAITARAAKAHGGGVLARNKEGGGLEVEIRLPCRVSEK